MQLWSCQDLCCYSSKGSSLNTAILCAVLWARRGKNLTSGRIAPSNSSIKTRSSTEFPRGIVVCRYSSEGRGLNTEIQCVIVCFTYGKNRIVVLWEIASRDAALLAGILRVRASRATVES